MPSCVGPLETIWPPWPLIHSIEVRGSSSSASPYGRQ